MFTFEPGVALWSIIAFLILLYFMQKYAYPPLRTILDERKTTIEFALQESQKNKQESKEMLSAAEEKLKNVKSEALQLMTEARDKARILSEEYQKKAKDQYIDLLRKKEEELHKTEEKFYKAMENDIVQTVIKACQKILKFDLSPEQKEKIVQIRIKELEELKDL